MRPPRVRRHDSTCVLRRPSVARAGKRVVGAKTSGRGYSLLEVLLALAILTLAGAALGELARLGMRNARVARDKTRAELHCESKLAEILAAGILPETVEAQPLEAIDPSEPPWLYSVAVEPTDHEQLVAIRVTVIEDLPLEQRPVECTLVRWMIDPETQASGEDATDSSSDSSGSSSGSSNTNAGTGGDSMNPSGSGR